MLFLISSFVSSFSFLSSSFAMFIESGFFLLFGAKREILLAKVPCFSASTPNEDLRGEAFNGDDKEALERICSKVSGVLAKRAGFISIEMHESCLMVSTSFSFLFRSKGEFLTEDLKDLPVLK